MNVTEHDWRCLTCPKKMYDRVQQWMTNRQLRMLHLKMFRNILPHLENVHEVDAKEWEKRLLKGEEEKGALIDNIQQILQVWIADSVKFLEAEEEESPWKPDEEYPSSESICEWIREIIPPPLTKPSTKIIDPDWLSFDGGIIPNLVKGMIEEKQFDRMPILADALEDAGCSDQEILNHCRGENNHFYMGCWVLELLTGK